MGRRSTRILAGLIGLLVPGFPIVATLDDNGTP